ncbi:hypothetical protein BC828DRAFT_406700 [Blastocladiella britannica]|nr:hypothetical protein BC828DRAFT_406700 [Blastocladiella britannica]
MSTPYLTESELSDAIAMLPPCPLGTQPRLVRDADIDPIVALTNLAYQDAVWFKHPSIHDRTSAADARDQSAQGNPSSTYICIDWPTASECEERGLPLPPPTEGSLVETDSGTGGLGSSGGPIALAINLHRDAWSGPGALMISLLAVHPRLHGRGLAKYIMALSVQISRIVACRERQSPRLVIEVVSVQSHLFDIYGKMGFEIVGKRTWDEFGVDPDMFTVECHLVLMQRQLEPLVLLDEDHAQDQEEREQIELDEGANLTMTVQA